MTTVDQLHQLSLPSHGILTNAQLRSLGVSRTVQQTMLAVGSIINVHRGVVRLPGYQNDHLQRCHAAMARIGGEGIISHRSAAVLLGVPLPEPTNVEITLPRASRPAKTAGVTYHRPTDRLDLRPIWQGALAVTNPRRTLLDLGASGTAADVAIALEHFLVGGRVTMKSIIALRERHRLSGRTGVSSLDRVLGDRRFGDKPPDSVLEFVFARLVSQFGLAQPMFHQRISIGSHHFTPDFVWPRHRVIVEVDGWAYHSGREANERDRERDLILSSAGWVPVRVTWLRVTRRPGWVAATLGLLLSHHLPT